MFFEASVISLKGAREIKAHRIVTDIHRIVPVLSVIGNYGSVFK